MKTIKIISKRILTLDWPFYDPDNENDIYGRYWLRTLNGWCLVALLMYIIIFVGAFLSWLDQYYDII